MATGSRATLPGLILRQRAISRRLTYAAADQSPNPGRHMNDGWQAETRRCNVAGNSSFALASTVAIRGASSTREGLVQGFTWAGLLRSVHRRPVERLDVRHSSP